MCEDLNLKSEMSLMTGDMSIHQHQMALNPQSVASMVNNFTEGQLSTSHGHTGSFDASNRSSEYHENDASRRCCKKTCRIESIEPNPKRRREIQGYFRATLAPRAVMTTTQHSNNSFNASHITAPLSVTPVSNPNEKRSPLVHSRRQVTSIPSLSSTSPTVLSSCIEPSSGNFQSLSHLRSSPTQSSNFSSQISSAKEKDSMTCFPFSNEFTSLLLPSISQRETSSSSITFPAASHFETSEPVLIHSRDNSVSRHNSIEAQCESTCTSGFSTITPDLESINLCDHSSMDFDTNPAQEQAIKSFSALAVEAQSPYSPEHFCEELQDAEIKSPVRSFSVAEEVKQLLGISFSEELDDNNRSLVPNQPSSNTDQRLDDNNIEANTEQVASQAFIQQPLESENPSMERSIVLNNENEILEDTASPSSTAEVIDLSDDFSDDQRTNIDEEDDVIFDESSEVLPASSLGRTHFQDYSRRHADSIATDMTLNQFTEEGDEDEPEYMGEQSAVQSFSLAHHLSQFVPLVSHQSYYVTTGGATVLPTVTNPTAFPWFHSTQIATASETSDQSSSFIPTPGAESDDPALLVDHLLSKMSCPICYRSFRRRRNMIEYHQKMTKKIEEIELHDLEDERTKLEERKNIIDQLIEEKKNGAKRKPTRKRDATLKLALSSSSSTLNIKKRRCSSSTASVDVLKCENNIEDVTSHSPSNDRLWETPEVDNDHETTEIWSNKCGHVYCRNCIETHLRQKKTCPVCNQTVQKKFLHPLFL